MKPIFKTLLILTVIAGFLLASLAAHTVHAQGDPDRPRLYVESYTTDSGMNVDPWGTFIFKFVLKNNGAKHAYGAIVTFNSSDFNPMQAGGVVSVGEDIAAKNVDSVTVSHQFKVSDEATWKYNGTLQAVITYMDHAGTQYTETFNFTLGINQQPVGPTKTPTPAPEAIKPFLVVTSNQTDINPLQPGFNFKLTLTINNLGAADARNVSLVYGGGASLPNPDAQGTPQPGTGSIGSSAELTNFAPLGGSNVVLLGDIPAGGSTSITSDFVTNVSTMPGAYPLKLSFIYTDPKGARMIDDGLITMLVLSLPQLEVSFYRDPGPISTDMPAQLPIQVTNISRKSVVLGNMIVTSTNGEVTNNTALVGSLEPGGYFTLDAMYAPTEEGPATLRFEIRYTDDFNQLRTYNMEKEIEVIAGQSMSGLLQPLLDEKGNPVLDEQGNQIMIDPAFTDGSQGGPSMDGSFPQKEPSFWSKLWNAIKGFFGLGTGSETPVMPEVPNEVPMPMPGGKG